MNDVLARRVSRLMKLYPAGYRRERADEIVATLVERSGDRRWPAPREVVGLARGAVQAHLSPGGPVSGVWARGLWAAVLLLFAVELGPRLLWTLQEGSRGRISLVMLALGAAAFHATLRDRRVVALGLAVAWQAAHIWWSSSVSPLLAVAALLLVASTGAGWGAARAPGAAGWWWAVPVAGVVYGLPRLVTGTPVYTYAYEQILAMTLIAALAMAALLDARAAITAAGLLLWAGANETMFLTVHDNLPGGRVYVATGVNGTLWGELAAALAVVMFLGGHLLARRRAKLV